MSTPTTKLLYLGTALTAVVLLLAGVPVSTVLTVAFLIAMMVMHLGGHGGHGGHGDRTGRGGSAEQPPRGGTGHVQHGAAAGSAPALRDR